MNRRQFGMGLAGAWAGVHAPSLHAQEFPSRPIKWICPYLPGTGPDNTVRILAEPMSELLRQPVVVENKHGAAGNIGAQMVARAAPDGYTWIYSATTMAASMRMYKKPGYDVIKDFSHVGRIATSDLLLIVRSDGRFKSLSELLEFGKRNPGKLTFASGGVGTPAHMGAELVLSASGVEALHVPYKGASESVSAVIGGHVDFALTIFSVSALHVDAGRLRPLAVSGAARNPRLREVPTLAEAGVPGVSLISFGGLSLPAGTPAPILNRISEVLRQSLERPGIRSRLEAQGGVVAPSSAAEYVEALRAEMSLTERLMKVVKLEPQ